MIENLKKLGSVLTKTNQKQIKGGTREDFENFHDATVKEFKEGINGAGCPTSDPCYSDTAAGCINYCMDEQTGR